MAGTPRVERRRERARLISEALFSDEAVLSLTPRLEGIILWVAIVVSADTAGRREGHPLVICNTILSELTEFTPDMVDSLLTQMADKKLITWYHVGNRKYVEISQYSKHQKFKYTLKTDIPDPLFGEDMKPMVEVKQDTESEELFKSLRLRVTAEFKGQKSPHNMYALARKLWNEGCRHEEQIMQVLRTIHAKRYTIKNPWAYIKSSGLLGYAMATGTEITAEKQKKEEQRMDAKAIDTLVGKLDTNDVGELVKKLVGGMRDESADPGTK